MISNIEASTFKTLPWKNGKGQTVELAINDGGTLEHFDWRISIAGVSENGLFSDFSGYQRNLVLVQGTGLELHHQHAESKLLDQPLKAARFDGADQTSGKLIDGAIKDFNLITRHTTICESLDTYPGNKELTVCLEQQQLAFCYSLSGEIIVSDNDQTLVINKGNLLKVNAKSEDCKITICGSDLIFIKLIHKN